MPDPRPGTSASRQPPAGGPLLDVRNLAVDFESSALSTRAVDGVSFSIKPGETLALVGESGSGKTVTALSILRILPHPGRVTAGEAFFGGKDLLKLPAEELRKIRGRDIGMIFQEPLSSLNPVLTCGAQVAEPLRVHEGMSARAARGRVVDLLDKVGIPDPARRAAEYPHQLSGGMRQRVMIAMALALSPSLLIADEPTTALDVTIQAQILDLLRRLRDDDGLTLLLITHNLGVVATMADRVVVMQNGRFVEEGTVDDIFERPRHPYTQALLDAVPRLDGAPLAARYRVEGAARPTPAAAGVPGAPPILEARGVIKKFPVGRDWIGRPNRWMTAVNGVDLSLHAGETLGLVGESGCGKTTFGRLLLRLLEPTAGSILFDGADLARMGRRRLRPHRRSLQMVFQDPAGSLNPRLTVEELLVEPLEVHGIARGASAKSRARELLTMVGLEPEQVRRYPHEFSGGQRQRIGIARALSLSPRLLVLDEPVSALDVSVQAQILDLLAGLKERLGLTYLFVAHDLAVVRSLSDRVAVMYLGEIVELGSTHDIYEDPLHPYTKALLAAVPRMDREARQRRTAPALRDEAVIGKAQAIAACAFESRCAMAVESCREARPPLVEIRPGRWLRCPVMAPGAVPKGEPASPWNSGRGEKPS